MKKILATSILLAALGCSSPDGDTWLISTSEEIITVSEAGDAWNELKPAAKQQFLAGDNTVGEFVSTLSRKTIIIAEISNEDYLFSPQVQSVRKCWLRSASYIAFRDSLETDIRSSVSPQDLINFRELIGKLVWYTDPAGSEFGPERLANLDWELAFAFDSMTPGQQITLGSGTFVLDSLVSSPDSMIQATIADTARVNSFAVASLTEKRMNDSLFSINEELSYSLLIDSAMVETWCSARSSVENDAVLASWEGGALTALDLDGIGDLTSLGQPVALESTAWAFHNLANHARQTVIEKLYSELYPGTYAELTGESSDFAASYASDLLFENNVLSGLEITDAMVLEAYETMEDVPTLPETRTFESVMLAAEEMDEAFASATSDTDAESFRFPGYTMFLAPGSEHVSRPVTASDLPGGMGTILFMIPEGNRDWQRPIEVQEGLFVMFRLDSILPPHPAALQDLETGIRASLLEHLTEQKTMDWLRELEEAHGLEINSGVLEDLPPDPSMWSDL